MRGMDFQTLLRAAIRFIVLAAKALGKGSNRTYNHISRKLDRFFETGWRRCYGWLGPLVAFYTFVWAPSHGISVDSGAVNVFLSTVLGAFVMRGVEKINEVRANPVPGGGMVNPAALA